MAIYRCLLIWWYLLSRCLFGGTYCRVVYLVVLTVALYVFSGTYCRVVYLVVLTVALYVFDGTYYRVE